jgi:hypothetical protein
MQPTAPGLGWYVSARQAWQTVADAEPIAYEPAGHNWHVSELAAGANLPSGQVAQVSGLPEHALRISTLPLRDANHELPGDDLKG